MMLKRIARRILAGELKDLRFQRDAANSKREAAHRQRAKELARIEGQRDDANASLRAADDRAAHWEKKAKRFEAELKRERDAHLKT